MLATENSESQVLENSTVKQIGVVLHPVLGEGFLKTEANTQYFTEKLSDRCQHQTKNISKRLTFSPLWLLLIT